MADNGKYSLNHVCVWSEESGWTPIKPDEASKRYPGGKFMCELCYQYVRFINRPGGCQTPHFRHSSQEEEKNCPERTGIPRDFNYDPKEHDLPIKLVEDITESSFHFELGLIRVPSRLLSEGFWIKITNEENKQFKYWSKRIIDDGLTLLSIGDIPSAKYYISFEATNDKLYKYWPKEVDGIDINGTIFELSGKKLTHDSEIEVNKEYYLLINKPVCDNLQSVSIEQVAKSKGLLCIYKVSAKALEPESARFFLRYHYRLALKPISIQIIWPPYIQGSYNIQYNQESVFILLKGDIRGNKQPIKTFPEAKCIPLAHNIKLYKINCLDRQQLISVGRRHALQYTYLWREASYTEVSLPEFQVLDSDNNPVCAGKNTKLPPNGWLRVRTKYNGQIIKLKNGLIIDKCATESDQWCSYKVDSYNVTIRIVIGLDCVWESDLIREKIDNGSPSLDEERILKQLNTNHRTLIVPPHSLKNMLIAFKFYPRIYNWIRESIRSGKIAEGSFRKIQSLYSKVYKNK